MKKRYFLIGALSVLSLAILSCTEAVIPNNGGFGDSGSTEKEEEVVYDFNITDLDGSLLEESLKLTETPTTNPELFTEDSEFSEEFNGDTFSSDWAAQSYTFETVGFNPSNVSVNDGTLDITLKFKDHTVSYAGDYLHLYFQSGLLRSEKTTTYGYYEARIKGADVFNGSCSAFWLYNVPWMPIEGDDGIDYENKISYNEIDIIELQQVASDFHIMSTNYHLMVKNQGSDGTYSNTFIRPASMWGENESLANWDSREDYHIYACENRPDSIIWYIDNQRVASIANYYWHLPMNITLSSEPRTPFETWENGERFPTPTTEEEAIAAGFPTTMKVDYVRTWRRKDYSQYASAKRDYNPSETYK